MLPNLDGAQPTLRSLHTVARLLGAVRLLVYERQPNFLELGLKVVPQGLSTDLLPAGGEVILDFTRLALVYRPASGDETGISISGSSQAALLETLLAAIHARELAAVVPRSGSQSYSDAAFLAADSFANRIRPKRDHLSDTTTLSFGAQAAADYAKALYAIFTGVARFRARLNGYMTPAVVWPEHFDLSFLWFAAAPDEAHPHLNFGFAPYSTGIDYPYFYAYAYPYPAQYAAPTLPPGARWNTKSWTGMVLPYAEVARHENAEAFVEDACELGFRSLRALLG
jgi:hypothetical protein